VKKVDYINPIFNNVSSGTKKQSTQVKPNISTKPRNTRSDKQKNIKFPVSSIMQIKLRSYCRQAERLYKKRGEEKLTQTKFNTLILSYGLKNPHLLKWDYEYIDTKVYMHTQLLETEYEKEIGGPHGLTVRKVLSDRKVVFYIITSIISWLEGSGDLEKIV
jgi:hypothetical protein